MRRQRSAGDIGLRRYQPEDELLIRRASWSWVSENCSDPQLNATIRGCIFVNKLFTNISYCNFSVVPFIDSILTLFYLFSSSCFV